MQKLNITKKIKKLWHDLYYKLANKKLINFALTCQEATAKVDLSDQNKNILSSFRLNLHLSLCQSCSNYSKTSLHINTSFKELKKINLIHPQKIEELNKELLKKYSK